MEEESISYAGLTDFNVGLFYSLQTRKVSRTYSYSGYHQKAATYKDVRTDLVSIDGDYGGRNVHMVS